MSAIPTADFIRAIWQPGDVREVRIPKYNGRQTAAGWFDDPELLAGAVDGWDGKANVYLTLNPVERALLARATNRIQKDAAATTADVNVTRRRWLLVDLDPVRPTGISSTEEEREAAHTKAQEVYLYLVEQGWPTPISGMSGNGYQLLYPIDLPNDDESRRLVEGVLAHLNAQFSDEAVRIDTAVGNAARIGCLFGTMKVKGDDAPDRPHRRSKLLTVPTDLISVPLDRLQALVPASNGHATFAAGDGFTGWVKVWLDLAGVRYREHEKDGAHWYRLDVCPVHPDDDIGGDCAVGELASGAAVGKCLHDRGTTWRWADFRDKLGLKAPTYGYGAAPPAPPPTTTELKGAGGRWLSVISTDPPPPRLLGRWSPTDHSIAYGPGGAGKGVLMSRDIVSMVQLGFRPLILDYENHPDEWARRIYGLDHAALERVRILNPLDRKVWTAATGALWDIAEQVRAEIEEHDRTHLIVDSLGPACMGMGMNDPDTVLRYSGALAVIALPTISIGQVNRAGDLSAPFGSVYWRYDSRAMWSVERAPGDRDEGEQEIILTDRKANNYGRAERWLVKVTWQDGIPVSASEQAYHLAVGDQVFEILTAGRWLTQAAIVAELNEGIEDKDEQVTAASVRQALRRGSSGLLPRFESSGSGKGSTWGRASA